MRRRTRKSLIINRDSFLVGILYQSEREIREIKENLQFDFESDYSLASILNLYKLSKIHSIYPIMIVDEYDDRNIFIKEDSPKLICDNQIPEIDGKDGFLSIRINGNIFIFIYRKKKDRKIYRNNIINLFKEINKRKEKFNSPDDREYLSSIIKEILPIDKIQYLLFIENPNKEFYLDFGENYIWGGINLNIDRKSIYYRDDKFMRISPNDDGKFILELYDAEFIIENPFEYPNIERS